MLQEPLCTQYWHGIFIAMEQAMTSSVPCYAYVPKLPVDVSIAYQRAYKFLHNFLIHRISLA